MTEFEMLLACYRSGQISERQWQEHLRDREFREWVEDQLPIKRKKDARTSHHKGNWRGRRLTAV